MPAAKNRRERKSKFTQKWFFFRHWGLEHPDGVLEVNNEAVFSCDLCFMPMLTEEGIERHKSRPTCNYIKKKHEKKSAAQADATSNAARASRTPDAAPDNHNGNDAPFLEGDGDDDDDESNSFMDTNPKASSFPSCSTLEQGSANEEKGPHRSIKGATAAVVTPDSHLRRGDEITSFMNASCSKLEQGSADNNKGAQSKTNTTSSLMIPQELAKRLPNYARTKRDRTNKKPKAAFAELRKETQAKYKHRRDQIDKDDEDHDAYDDEPIAKVARAAVKKPKSNNKKGSKKAKALPQKKPGACVRCKPPNLCPHHKLCVHSENGVRCTLGTAQRTLEAQYCAAHGGGKPCQWKHGKCTKSAYGSTSFCIFHGGGLRCKTENCPNAALSGGLCSHHGGGHRCEKDGCEKGAVSGGLCTRHGGGHRCEKDGCEKGAVSGGLCTRHGGGHRCVKDGCEKGAVNGSFCRAHRAAEADHFKPSPAKKRTKPAAAKRPRVLV
jgi:hypothetical protein